MSTQLFQHNSQKRLPYNNFNLSAELLTSGQIGKLIPIWWSEVYPHDKFRFIQNHLIRLAPLSAPTMARFNVHFHAFYVPYRIITERNSANSTWDEMIKSIGSSDLDDLPVLPYMAGDIENEAFTTYNPDGLNYDDVKIGSLWDYLGLPIPRAARVGDTEIPGTLSMHIPDDMRLSLLPFLAYQKIYDDFYRRDQIEKEFKWPLSLSKLDIANFSLAPNSESEYKNPEDGNVDFGKNESWKGLFKLRTRNYERDYFTSSLPDPQFGDDVSIGGDIQLTDDASIGLIATSALRGYGVVPQANNVSTPSDGQQFPISGEFNSQILSDVLGSDGNIINNYRVLGNASSNSTYPGGYAMYFLPLLPAGETSIPFDVKEIQGFSHGFSINELRLAMQLQGVRELINRGGTRTIEIYQSIYQVTVPDARLQRAQFLGGCKNAISIGSVIQTSASEDGSPLGEMAGKGIASGRDLVFQNKQEFKENGIVMVIMSITPRTGYYGGIPRKFLKRDWFDFYIPQFDHIGEMEIYRSELYCDWQNTEFESRDVFGYQMRNADLKSGISTVTGEFRESLDNWHVLRDFGSEVGLNLNFIKAESDDFNRIFQFEDVSNTSNEQFYAQFVFDVKSKRSMSKYSTPFVLG